MTDQPVTQCTDASIQDISDWIIAQALTSQSLDNVLTGICQRLNQVCFNLVRVNVAMSALHPTIVAQTISWMPGHGSDAEDVMHSNTPREDWLNSPIKVLTEGETEVRHRLDRSDSWQGYPILERLHSMGATDYFASSVSFSNTFSHNKEAIARIDGVILSWATDQGDGFTEHQINVLRRLLPRIAITAKIANRERRTLNILGAYLGGDAAERVLNGQIRLGDGDVIPSVIWYSDMRNSTPLADRLPGPEFLALLNAFFDCTAGAVLHHGGDVLRFIGDAVLAIFPIEQGRFTVKQACEAALKAAFEAEKRVLRYNRNLDDPESPEIGFGLGLHKGEVLFGNIGIPERVEFSVIGPAANEVARLEGLTKQLGKPVLISQAFRDGLDPEEGKSLEYLGDFPMKGVGTLQKIYTPINKI